MSTKKVEQLKKRFVEEGFEAALSRKPVTNVHRRKITGDEEAHVIALYCSQAPAGHERWTLRMLADKMQYRKSRPVSPSSWNSALWGLAPKCLFCMSLHC